MRRLRREPILPGARARILAAFVVLLALSELVSAVVGRQILLARAGERVDDGLAQEVDEFRRLAREGRDPRTNRPFGTDVRRLFDVFLQRNVPGENEAFFTFLGGRPYRATETDVRSPALRSALARLARVAQVRRGEVETGDERFRYLAVPVRGGTGGRSTFVVAIDVVQEEQEIADAVQVGAGVAIGVLALATLLAYAVAGRILAPLRELSDAARSITESDLTRRIDVRGRDEVAELARQFNAMVDRLEGAFASQRALVSDAGHELRTPITIIRGHLELMGDDPEERRETLALVGDELDRMARFVEDLLLLAKAERGDFLRLEDLDLDVLTEELMAKARALAPRRWRLEQLGTGRIRADRQRLTQAMMSLAHNAVQQTEDGDPIALGSTLEDGWADLWVQDAGPGVATEDVDRIFERFARGGDGRRRSEGAGLGLAIVKAIAEAHGGRVTLDAGLGRGARFTLELPAEPRREVAAA